MVPVLQGHPVVITYTLQSTRFPRRSPESHAIGRSSSQTRKGRRYAKPWSTDFLKISSSNKIFCLHYVQMHGRKTQRHYIQNTEFARFLARVYVRKLRTLYCQMSNATSPSVCLSVCLFVHMSHSCMSLSDEPFINGSRLRIAWQT